MIVQGFTVRMDRQASVLPLMTVTASLDVANDILVKHQMRDVQGVTDIAKVTVSGIGLRSHTHVAIVLFQQLADDGINVEMINTSELQVNAVIDAKRALDAAEDLKRAFADSLL